MYIDQHTPLTPTSHTLSMLWFLHQGFRKEAHAIIMATPKDSSARPIILRASWREHILTPGVHVMRLHPDTTETIRRNDPDIYMQDGYVEETIAAHQDMGPIPSNDTDAMNDIVRRWTLCQAAQERQFPEAIIPALQYIITQHRPAWMGTYSMLRNGRIDPVEDRKVNHRSIRVHITHPDTDMYHTAPPSSHAYQLHLQNTLDADDYYDNYTTPNWMTKRILFRFCDLEIYIPPLILNTQHAQMTHRRTHADIITMVQTIDDT